MKRTILAIVAALAFLFTTATPASAFPYDAMTICNSTKSYESIVAYRLVNPNYFIVLFPGNCKTLNNYTGSVRVSVESESYRRGKSGKGYGGCINAPATSNPPNDQDSITYKTYRRNNCVN